MRYRDRRTRPPWWPQQEPWPPTNPQWYWHRRRFARRMGFIAAAFFLVMVVGIVSVIRFLAGHVIPGAGFPIYPLAALLVAFIFFFGMMRRVGMPFTDVVSAAQRVGDGDFNVRLREVGPPFVRSIARAFNTMIGRLKVQDEQRRQLMAEVAHELRTPLAVMQGRLEGMVDGVYPRDEAHVKGLLEDAQVLTRLVEDLRTLANIESGAFVLEREPTDVSMLITTTVNSFHEQAESQGLTLIAALADGLPTIDLDPVRMRQVLTNVIANALQHTPPGGSVTVAAATSGQTLRIIISDTGSGIAKEELPKIFERFYKGPASRGSGLGLPIARKLVVAHGGSIDAESDRGQGTRISITLPLSS